MQHILQHIFKKSSLDEIPVKALQQFTKDHPLFAIGHFLLAKKLQEKNDPDRQQQFYKTVLYFHYPLWLEYKLKTGPAVNVLQLQEAEEESPVQVAEAASIIRVETDVQPEPVITRPEDVLGQQETLVAAPGPEYIPVQPEEIPVQRETEDTGGKTVAGPELVPVQSEPVVTDEPLTIPAQAAPVVTAEPEPVPVHPMISEQLDENQDDPDDTDAPEHVDPKEEKLAFQAYHTVDYFASQGIRLSHEVKSEDKLGKQMKSFTEWLKTMRRLPQATVEEVLDTKTNDKEIEQIAADSLEDNEVLTETMAMVLAKQGKITMAREIYNKLSLLNPHKSAYFAAKIEDLNKHLT